MFDHDGRLRARLRKALRQKPTMTFEEAQARFLQGREVDGMMNQVSPRIFEAVALGTGLILFEGSYSGVVRPDEHYLSLKKDFSNVDDVLARAQDNRFLEAMIDRTHNHVIGSGLYTYQRFIRWVEQVLEPRVARKLATLHSSHHAPRDETITRSVMTTLGGELADLVESGVLERQPGVKSRPPRRVELVRIAQLALFDPGRVLARLSEFAWNLLVRLVWTAPLRRLQGVGSALVKTVCLLPTLLGVPLVRRCLGRGLAGELSRLVILRQARLANPQTLGFQVVPQVASGSGGLSLSFISLPVGLADSAARNRLVLEQVQGAASLRAIRWDHSAIGSSIRYPLQGKLTARFPLETGGVYHFKALVELARSRPEQVRDLLLWVLAVGEQGSETRQPVAA